MGPAVQSGKNRRKRKGASGPPCRLRGNLRLRAEVEAMGVKIIALGASRQGKDVFRKFRNNVPISDDGLPLTPLEVAIKNPSHFRNR